MPHASLGRRNYEEFADRYAEIAATKPHNAYYERPATLSLLPTLAGKRVLDAGCGPGFYAEAILEQDPASLVCVDVTPRMVELTRARVGERALVLPADLEQPLDFDDGSFDVVVCPLVLDYIEDWGGFFIEVHRVLAAGGTFVYSHGHPMADYQLVKERCNPESIYFETERFALEWKGFGPPYPRIESFRRSLTAMIEPLIGAGLVMERVLEPKPTEDFRRAAPEGYAYLMRQPVFLCVRARKPG
ncbi:MAG: class I SAM-dependent methyltransferase [Myxococcales bacterium]|nr:class I SAM-dependent methyltransferase [Myxococcales bacterium]